MVLPWRLRAWNLLFPGSKAESNWTIRARVRESGPNTVLMAAHYPADFARIGDPIPGHDLVDVLVDGQSRGGVGPDDSVLTLDRLRARAATITLRGFTTNVDLVELALPVRDDEVSIVLEFWPRRRWVFGLTSAGTYRVTVVADGTAAPLTSGRLL